MATSVVSVATISEFRIASRKPRSSINAA